MKNCTVVKSTSWLIQLCSPILLSYGKPILDSKLPSADLLIAKRMAKTQKTTLLSFSGEVKVYVQVYFGAQKWKLGVTQTSLSIV